MDFKEAYLKIVEASKEKDTVEIPTILSCVDFKGKKCLSVGCGPLARLAVKFVEAGAESITCLENYDNTRDKAKKVVTDLQLDDKIEILLNKDKKKLSFDDNSFDIVYGSWLPHSLTTDENFLSEIVRVSKKNVLLVMPGIDDDIVEMKSIVYPGEKERRQGYRDKIVSYLESNGVKVELKEGMLKLDFENFENIKGVFELFDFAKGDEGKEDEVDSYLRERVHNMSDGFYCVVGTKV
jgi:ubiquinone/menaquinone biosynthesis C-methylase UbiE